jgi:hypothetical protein
MTQGISGILFPHCVELPYATAKEAEKAKKLNDELAGTGFRTFRAAYDWGYFTFDDLEKNPRSKNLFKSGDLVKVFKTVSAGDVLWSGQIDYSRKEYHHGIQKGFSVDDWAKMFGLCWPAELDRNGKVLYGSLEIFAETGTEGPIWSVHEYGKSGYDGLNCLEDGDILTVFKNVKDGDVAWEGAVSFGPEKVERLSDKFTEIMRRTLHMPSSEWLDLSYQHCPFIIKPK